MNIKKSIDIALATKQKSKKWLAEQAGMDYKHIYTIGHQKAANTRTVEKMAKALGMKVSEFIALGEEEVS